MSTLLPLFPLQLVAFPGEDLNLHIFEPRYKQLFQECDEEGTLFGIPPYIDGAVKDFGTLMKLEHIAKRYESGELDVRTKGVGLFKLQDFHDKAPGKLYAGGSYESVEYNLEGDFLLNDKILVKLGELFELLKIDKEVPTNDDAFHTYTVAHQVGMSVEQEYEFLQILDERERQEYMLQHLQRLIPIVQEMNNLRNRVQMNGHFKNIIPPEL